MKIRNLLLSAVVAVTLALGLHQAALAQSEPAGFRNVTLWVNPEYDDPRLLVMLEGKITGADAPAQVRFLVPATAEMYSSGSKDAQGNYSGGPPERQASSVPGWDEISYQLKTDTFRVEYYDNISGLTEKKIPYEFRTLYPIVDMTVIVQEPRTSSNFTVLPEGTKGYDGEGLVIHTSRMSDVASGAPLRFGIAYTKTDSSLSVSKPPPASNKGGGISLTAVVIISVIGAALVGALIMAVVKGRKGGRSTRRALSGGGQSRAARRRDGKGGRFCTQCGRPVRSSAQFCPNCGNKIR